MKKIFYLASIAALAFSSCAKDETTGAVVNTVGGSKIMATAQDDATRTHLELNANGNYEFRWSENDVLGVFGDGTNSAHNVPFSLLDGYSDQAEGIFESNYKLLNGSNFMAYYPFVPGATVEGNLFEYDAVTKAATQLDTDNIDLFQINKEQNYKPGSFNTFTAPAVSDNFMVDEDGNADVTMQPVADYLYVNLRGTEHIETVSLLLWTADFSHYETVNDGRGYWVYKGDKEDKVNIPGRWTWGGYVPPYTLFPDTTEDDWVWVQPTKEVPVYKNYDPVDITGKGTLKSYTYIDADENESIRYYLSNEGMRGGNTITLRTGQLTDIVCHDVNTYAFVVPAGILGMNPVESGLGKKEVVAEIIVNKGLKLADGTSIEEKYRFGGKALNGGYALKANGTEDLTKPMWRQWNEDGSSNYKMENTVFFANATYKGARTSQLYNPENDFIIYDEVDFLQYMNEYGKENTTVNFRNAYVCSNHSFDFSEENMGKLATEIKGSNHHATGTLLRQYIDDYVSNGVPCIDEYFAKFKGNGATFTALKNLQSKDGMFGNISRGAVIKDITFEDLVAPTYVTDEPVLDEDGDVVHNSKGEIVYESAQGVVLGTADDTATLSKVGVVNANAHAILTDGQVHHYEGLIIEDAEDLEEIICNFEMEKDLTFKNWDAVSVVDDVFGQISAVTGAKGDEHHVVTIAKGGAAEYDKLAGNITVYRGSDMAISVVIDNVSYWTGSTVNTAAYNPKDPYQIYQLDYAEQLAAGKDQASAAMTRDMDANYENIEISWPNLVPYGELNGNGNTVKGIVLNTTVNPSEKNPLLIDAESVAGEAVAPFNAPVVAYLTMDGVEINLEADNVELITVPAYVGGVTDFADTIYGVVVKNLNIDTFEVSKSLNHDAYYGSVVPKIGWIAAVGHNTQVAASSAQVSYSALEGIAGLVGGIEIDNNDSNFNTCSVSVANIAQDVVSDFTKYTNKIKNAAGTMVGLVVNDDNKAHGIEFKNSGKPVFLYDIALPEASIVVYYNDVPAETLTK